MSSPWIHFAFPEDLLIILDKLLKGGFNVGTATRAQAEFVDSVFTVLGSSTSIPTISSALNERLMPLSEFCLSEVGTTTVVRSVFSRLLKQSLPLGYDGCLGENHGPLSQVLVEAEDRWERRLQPLAPGIRIETFLTTRTWTTTHVGIITPLFYRSRTIRAAFSSLLERGMTDELGVDLLVPLLHGFLDSCPPEYVVENRTWEGYFSQLLELVWRRHGCSSKLVGSAASIFRFSQDRKDFASMLSKRLEKSPVETVCRGVLVLASKIWDISRDDSEGYVGEVVDHAMQWAVLGLSDGSKLSEGDTAMLVELGMFHDLHIFCKLTVNLYRSSHPTNKKCKSSSGGARDCFRDQAPPTHPRGRLLMYNTNPTLYSEGMGSPTNMSERELISPLACVVEQTSPVSRATPKVLRYL
jgi:hypothetical protein